MTSLIENIVPEPVALLGKINDRILADHIDKAGAVVIEADAADVDVLRMEAAGRMPILDSALESASTDEERKPHFGEHSAWRALLRQIDQPPR